MFYRNALFVCKEIIFCGAVEIHFLKKNISGMHHGKLSLFVIAHSLDLHKYIKSICFFNPMHIMQFIS